MGDQWERLKGKTYPDTLAEQLTTLETDETLISYKKQRERMAQDRIVRSITCPLYQVWETRTGFANGRDGITCSTNSVPKGATGATGGIATPMTWCIGGSAACALSGHGTPLFQRSDPCGR